MPVRTAFTPTAAAGNVLTAAQVKQIPGGWIGFAESTTLQSLVGTATETDLTGFSLTVTVGSNRRIKLSAGGLLSRTVADGVTVGRFKEGSTELGRWAQHSPSALTEFDMAYGAVVLTPTAGSHTYKLTLQRFSGTGNVTLNSGAGTPTHFLIEDLGPAS